MKMRGFTLIEIILVMSVAFILLGIATVNLSNFQHESQLSAVSNTFLADLREQQTKAMAGDTEGSGQNANYGVHFETNSYTLFRGALGTANFAIDIPKTINISTSSDNNQIIFAKGSGEVVGFTDGENTITLTDIVDQTQQVITFNRYGVVTAIN
ncbi:MAG: pilus assembly FimT family protein [Acidobacteriota bacterium]